MAKTVLEHFPGYHTAEGGNCEGRTNHSPPAVLTSLSSFLLGKLLVRLEFEFSHLTDGTCSLILGLVLGSSTCLLHFYISQSEHTEITKG